jgi:heme-degrading monooxygenase HmoA
MFSVLFEVNRKPERKDAYLAMAKHLKPILERVEGFVDNERFESLRRPGWLLSHSTWADEKAVVRWRTVGEHHRVQEKGRADIFSDYHLRVGDVMSDTAAPANAPVDEMRFDVTKTGAGRYVTFVEVTPQEGALVPIRPEDLPLHLSLPDSSPDLCDVDVWKSIYVPGKLALTASWRTEDSARSWAPPAFEGVKDLRRRVVRIVRDYSMRDRREAPQYFPEAR